MEDKKTTSVRRTENDSQEINTVNELIKACLRSKSFDVLIVLMIGVVWYGAYMVKQAVYGGDSTGALLAIYVYPILVAIFCMVVFMDMIFITKGRKKRNSTMILFVLLLIVASTFVFFCFPLDI